MSDSTPRNVASWPQYFSVSHPKKLALELLEAYQLLMDFFKGDPEKVATWMTVANPNLGNSIPLRLFFNDRGHKVLAFIRTAIDENKSDGESHG